MLGHTLQSQGDDLVAKSDAMSLTIEDRTAAAREALEVSVEALQRVFEGREGSVRDLLARSCG